MAILSIRTFPDPILREKADDVEAFDDTLRKLVSDMLDTMYDAPGVGLAANQVGVPLKVIVLDYNIEGEDDNLRKYINKNPRVIINPVLVKKSGHFVYREGCLSVPGYYEEVERSKNIQLQYQDEFGKSHTIDAEGLLGVAIQHEMDHLDGRLFIDRLSMVKRSKIKGKIKKKRDKKFERSKFHVEL